jgi:hypothetical protein
MKCSRWLVILLATISLSVGCTSKNVEKEDTDVAALTGEDASADDEFAGDEADAATDESATSEEGFDEDEAGDVATEDDEEAGEVEGLDEGDEVATKEDKDSSASNDDLNAALDSTEDVAKTDSSPTSELDTDSSSGALGGDETAGMTDEAPVYKPVIPLKKMVTAPYTKDGILVNAIYIARDGDSLKSVANKIFGSDKSSDLKKVNSNLANRSLKVGDKIYYNSPQRPTDNTQVLTYYEDIGLSAENYEVQAEGENIRVISKKLLGDDNSWKEIWSTNLEVESKDILPLGTRLRYWGADVAKSAAPVLAANNTPSMDSQTSMDANNSAQTPGFEQVPSDTATSQDIAQMPDQAPTDASSGTVEPPPPPADMSSPPPPPPPVAGNPEAPVDANAEVSASAEEEQMIMMVGGGLLLLTVILLVIIIRKKRSKRGIDFQTATHTQIE